MKKNNCFILCLVIVSVNLFGNGGQKLKLAKELMQTMHLEKQLKQTFVMVKKMQASMIKKMLTETFKKSKKISDEASNFQKEILEYFEEKFTGKKYIESFSLIYSEVYTEEELKSMIKFYKSDVGQSIIKKTSLVTKKTMKIAQDMILEVMPKIKKKIEDMKNKKQIKDKILKK